MYNVKAYYNEIKTCTDRDPFLGTWEMKFYNKDTSSNPNALCLTASAPFTFYKLYGMLLYYSGMSEIHTQGSINIEQFINDRLILFEAEDQDILSDEYYDACRVLYLAGVRDPNVLDPRRYAHPNEYVLGILNSMVVTKDYNYSTVDDDLIDIFIIMYFEMFYKQGIRFQPFLPFEVIDKHLEGIEWNHLFHLIDYYKYPITYERVLKCNSKARTCLYLHACETLPKNIDLESLHTVFIKYLGENHDIKDQRLIELVTLYSKAYPSESMNDILEGISIHHDDHIPKCLSTLLEMSEYDASKTFNTECLICRQTFKPKQSIFVFRCNHAICKECMDEYVSTQCPIHCDTCE